MPGNFTVTITTNAGSTSPFGETKASERNEIAFLLGIVGRGLGRTVVCAEGPHG
jgi:hypothetical protein